jgi:two-component system response regulator
MEQRCLLHVEDDNNDVLLFALAAESAGITCPIRVARDEKEAIKFLSAHHKPDSLPRVVLLDFELTGLITGLKLLRWLRGRTVFRDLPVIVHSSSTHREDVHYAYHLGANAYMQKPAGFNERVAFASELRLWLEGKGDLPNQIMNPGRPVQP